ncbi:MAG: tRNA pseudouridine(55) synthase TruB [Chloroflexota bacterium]
MGRRARGGVIANGIIPLNKPGGITSMDVVRAVKRLTGVRRVGHAGTLDPIATGVLPVCLGQGTRLMERLVDGGKRYRGEVTLGSATDTYDAAGQQTVTGSFAHVTREQVEAALAPYHGTVLQRPPMYSALKHEGQRLYELARAGVEVEREPREVVVHAITLEAFAPPVLRIEVRCGRGFYMRTLAHELGEALGVPAHLSALERTEAGPFALAQTVMLEDLEASGEAWREHLLPPDAAVDEVQAATVEPAAERHLRNGQPVSLPSAGVYAGHLEERRAYSVDGRFIALVRFNRMESLWHPEKVFDLPEPSPLAP